VNVHESVDVDVNLTDVTTTPFFVPLVDLYPGRQLMAGQSFLRWEGVNHQPVDMQITLAPLGTKRGTLEDEPIVQSDIFPYLDPPEGEVLEWHVPELRNMTGVIGVTMPNGELPAGARLTGRVSVVYGTVGPVP
jgi:hypothetical protein